MIPYAYVSIQLAGVNDAPPAMEMVRYDDFVRGLAKPGTEFEMKTHTGLGLSGETGELVGVIKDDIIFRKTHTKEGKTIRDAIIEELGDLQWYIQLTMQMYDIMPREVFQSNADKLAKRYVNLKYSDREATVRADKAVGF